MRHKSTQYGSGAEPYLDLWFFIYLFLYFLTPFFITVHSVYMYLFSLGYGDIFTLFTNMYILLYIPWLFPSGPGYCILICKRDSLHELSLFLLMTLASFLFFSGHFFFAPHLVIFLTKTIDHIEIFFFYVLFHPAQFFKSGSSCSERARRGIWWRYDKQSTWNISDRQHVETREISIASENIRAGTGHNAVPAHPKPPAIAFCYKEETYKWRKCQNR